MPDGTQFVLDNKKDTAETVGEVENNLGLSPTDNVSKESIHDSNEESKTQMSDRETESTYDIMGQNERLKKRNQMLMDDLARLRERLKLEVL